MPLIHTIDGVRHVRPAVPIHKDRVPSQREVEVAIAVLRERYGKESGKQLDVIERALTHRRLK
jgi:hypothetical protein